MRYSAPIRPGRGVITITRCDRYTDSNTECVTKMTVLRRLAPQREQIVVEPEAGDLVERRERFIHQQDVGIGDQRARERYPHLHAAGQFARIGVGELGKPHPRSAPRSTRAAAVGRRHVRQFQRQPHIVPHAGPWHQRRLLKYEADGMPLRAGRADRRHADAAGRRRARGRRSSAARSTCRSRTARAATRTRPCARRDRAAPAPPRRCHRSW